MSEHTLVVVTRTDPQSPITHRVISTIDGVRIETTIAEFVTAMSLQMSRNPFRLLSRRWLYRSLHEASEAAIADMKHSTVYNPPAPPGQK